MNAPVENITLDLSDPLTYPALSQYAKDIAESNPELSADIGKKIAAYITKDDVYISVGDTEVPGFGIVPDFRVAKFIAGRGLNDTPISTETATPWNHISYDEAERVTKIAGRPQISVTQSLAIAYQIINQDENWTGGKVGEGDVFMGLHKGTVDGPQPATYIPSDPEERRWHVLANGEPIYDFSGNLFQYMRDDLHGNERGLVEMLPSDSLLLKLPPYPSMKKGMGWRPDADDLSHWSGRALFRGGFWRSYGSAGVFRLDGGDPRGVWRIVGVRCTYPN